MNERTNDGSSYIARISHTYHGAFTYNDESEIERQFVKALISLPTLITDLSTNPTHERMRNTEDRQSYGSLRPST